MHRDHEHLLMPQTARWPTIHNNKWQWLYGLANVKAWQGAQSQASQ